MMSTKQSPLTFSQRRAVGRPAGEVHLALLQAAAAIRLERLASGQGATLSELVARSCVGLQVARNSVPKLKKRGHLVIVGERLVPGRNRPAAEYAPARKVSDIFDDSGRAVLSQCMAGWGK